MTTSYSKFISAVFFIRFMERNEVKSLIFFLKFKHMVIFSIYVFFYISRHWFGVLNNFIFDALRKHVYKCAFSFENQLPWENFQFHFIIIWNIFCNNATFTFLLIVNNAHFTKIPSTHLIDLGVMKRLSLPWSRPVVLNTRLLDWESSALTTPLPPSMLFPCEISLICGGFKI